MIDARHDGEVHVSVENKFLIAEDVQGSDVIAYHGTTAEVAKKIAANGLKVRRGKTYAQDPGPGGENHYVGERGQSVYITSDKDEALRFAAGRAWKLKNQKKREPDVVVFKMQMPRTEWERLKSDEEHEHAKRAPEIPPKYFSEYRIYHDKSRWDDDLSRDQFEPDQYELAKIVKLKAADDKVTLFMSFMVDDLASGNTKAFDPSEPRDDAGKWTSGGGGGSEPEIADTHLDPKVIAVGGDEWNKATARRLEHEYQKAKPELQKLLDALDKPKGEGAGGPTPVHVGEDGKPVYDFDDPAFEKPDEEDVPYVPESWDEMRDSDQTDAEETYYSQELKNYVESENQNWYDSGGALDESKATLASMSGGFVYDTLKEHIEGKDEDGEPNTDTKFPYTPQQLNAAISLEYESNGEGTGDLKIEFNDDELQEPANAPPNEQGTLPGIEPEDLSKRLTEKMREDLTTMIGKAFEKEADDKSSSMEPPEYLADSAKEFMEENWAHNMSDEEKYAYAKNNTSTIDDLESLASGTSAAASSEYNVTGLPDKFDPLNESSGIDYKKTQRIARLVSVRRAQEVLKARGLPDPGFAQDERSSTAIYGPHGSRHQASEAGQLLQVATAGELERTSCRTRTPGAAARSNSDK